MIITKQQNEGNPGVSLKINQTLLETSYMYSEDSETVTLGPLLGSQEGFKNRLKNINKGKFSKKKYNKEQQCYVQLTK